jgi:hypothetical protein
MNIFFEIIKEKKIPIPIPLPIFVEISGYHPQTELCIVLDAEKWNRMTEIDKNWNNLT